MQTHTTHILHILVVLKTIYEKPFYYIKCIALLHFSIQIQIQMRGFFLHERNMPTVRTPNRTPRDFQFDSMDLILFIFFFVLC